VRATFAPTAHEAQLIADGLSYRRVAEAHDFDGTRWKTIVVFHFPQARQAWHRHENGY
jgi:hypothetical protein